MNTIINVVALANDLALNATKDELIIYPQYPDYDDEADLYMANGKKLKKEVQEVYDRWFEFYTNHIKDCEPEKLVTIYLEHIDGGHISTIIAVENENVEAYNKVKMAFEEDMNCKVISMTKFKVHEVLEGKVKSLQVKYELEEYDYSEPDAPEPEQTTIYLAQTWVY